MLSPSLEQTLQLALTFAGERNQEFATLEHLLLAMLDDRDTVPFFMKMKLPIEKLEQELTDFIDKDLSYLVLKTADIQPKPTIAMQRVFQRAALQVQSSGRDMVTALHLIIAMFAEKDSYAVYFLQKYGVERLAVMNFLSDSSPVSGVDDDYMDDIDPLEEFCINLNEKVKEGRVDPLIGRDCATRASLSAAICFRDQRGSAKPKPRANWRKLWASNCCVLTCPNIWKNTLCRA